MKRLLPLLILVSLLTACSAPSATAGTIQVSLQKGEDLMDVVIPAGSTVQDALDASGWETSSLDKVDPPRYTVLADGTRITIIEVTERFEIEQVPIPFESQTIRNEALPEGERRLIQPGTNGLQEITYRIVEEEGVEILRTPIKNVVLEPAVPEIVMIGSQSAYAALPIEGMLVYATGGNAWLVQGNTSNRRPLTLSGDLDGRVLELSPDGEWLLYTRVTEEDEINSLWVLSLTDPDAEPIATGAVNIVHFAEWQPSETASLVAYSTSEPSPSPPGWQANNDLILIRVYSDGRISLPATILEPNAGGLYGWWGTQYAWDWTGTQLAYARADGIGLVDIEGQSSAQLVGVTSFQTLSDWAWVTGVAWGHDNETLYFIDHGAPIGLETADSSPVFNLVALQAEDHMALTLQERTGMFAQPVVSPADTQPNGEILSRIAFLQSLSPLESEDSTYQLCVMDRDGSNLNTLFPPEGETGLQPQRVHWSPDGVLIALIYRGDLWMVDATSGQGQRLTGDAQVQTIDWIP